jgi:hypothetical protein
METLSLTKEQKNQVIVEFLDSIKDWKDCFKLTQFVLMKLSEEAIRMNAGELVLSQGMNHDGERYMTRMSIQYSKDGDSKSLEERSYDLASKIAQQYPEDSALSILQKGVIAGYNLHLDDFEEGDNDEED